MKFFNLFKWSAVHLAWLTMSFSPLAMGVEAEKLNKQRLTQFVQEFGLNKKTTLGEFWEKSKAYYPGYAYKEIESFVKQNRNLEMPEVIVSTSKATDGSEIPNLQITQNGRVQSIQIFNEKSKWAKFNNAVLTASDMERPDEIFNRLLSNDARLKTEAGTIQKKNEAATAAQLKNQSQQQKDLARFQGFPRMNPQLWKSMTPIQRAGFIVNMRLLWMDSQKVLDATNVSQSKKKNSSVKNIFDTLISEALAQSNTGILSPPPPFTAKSGATPTNSSTSNVSIGRVPAKAAAPKVFDANSCIVAGYIGVYDKVDNSRGKNRLGCSVERAIDTYHATESLTDVGSSIKNANKVCSEKIPNGGIACNPLVYGFPSGQPACVDKNSASFQTATHYNGSCDSQSPLTSSKKPVFNDKDYSKIMPREKQIAMIEADQEMQKNELTKQFLQGVLSSKDDKSLFNLFQKGEWSNELDTELVRIQKSFEDEINGAIKTCEVDTKNKNEINQKGACDQLHRRWLFTEKFLIPIRAKACAPGTKYIGTDKKIDSIDKNPLLCQCENDANKKVGLGKAGGGQCAVVVSPVEKQKVEPKKEAPVVDLSCPSGTRLLQGGDENKCICSNNKDKYLPQSTPPEKVAELCEEKSNAWKWILGGLGVLISFALLNRNKSSNPIPPSNPPPLCDANKKLVGQACVCTVGCSGVDQIQNPNSCVCSAPPVVQQCAAPKVGTFPDCVCPAGSSGVNGECAKTSEGGSGANNCPSGNCSGGVPTAK